ncbi:MAG: pyridoxamine 5'-phosphate oxidase family protein [Bacteroidota bacterium]
MCRGFPRGSTGDTRTGARASGPSASTLLPLSQLPPAAKKPPEAFQPDRRHRVAMLTTIDTDGAPWSCSMALPHPGAFDGTLSLFPRADSERVEHIERNAKVSLAFAKPGDNTYATLTGSARVTNDRQKIQNLWSPLVRAWWPDSPEDPSLRSIEIDVDRAEFWDSPSSDLVYAVGLAKALVTGEPATSMGENAQVTR